MEQITEVIAVWKGKLADIQAERDWLVEHNFHIEAQVRQQIASRLSSFIIDLEVALMMNKATADDPKAFKCWQCGEQSERSDIDDRDGYLYVEFYCQKCDAYMELESEPFNAFWREGIEGEAIQWRTVRLASQWRTVIHMLPFFDLALIKAALAEAER